MNIFFVGYYDDFSRFFLKLKYSIQEIDGNVNIKYFSLYFSGFLYWVLRSRGVSLISFRAMLLSFSKKYRYVKDEYRGIGLDSLVSYHVKLGADSVKLKKQACAYIDIFSKEFEKKRPDLVVCSSDSRLIAEVLKEISKRYDSDLFFFEQGPYSTTVIDKAGVNANSSIRGFIGGKNEIDDITILNVKNFPVRERKPKYKRFFLYRTLDFFLEYLLGKFGLYPIDITKSTSFNFIKPKENDEQKEHKQASRLKRYLLVLQVPFDVNMINHSPYFSNHYEIVKSVNEALPRDSELIIREHPLFYNKYESILYDYIRDNNLCIDSETKLEKAIKDSDVVVVNNSTVGLESISLNIPTVVLGDSFYDSSDVCIKLKDLSLLPQCLSQALQYKYDKNAKINFLRRYYLEYLFDGHFRDDELKLLCEKISIFLLGRRRG
ncbi:hypothetical protein M2G94_08690 [Vibrio vulnificus]|nr:hypothetical protein [Vibrio vulnificus]HAS6329550.1 hypothetical protein [Vibrio vulnificus]HDY7567189.1 hypothetical protein [Vibrio vulnificus]